MVSDRFERGESDPIDVRFALLLGCFLLSGAAALVYQTAWTRELSFVFGTSEPASPRCSRPIWVGSRSAAAVAARVAPRLRRPVAALAPPNDRGNDLVRRAREIAKDLPDGTL